MKRLAYFSTLVLLSMGIGCKQQAAPEDSTTQAKPLLEASATSAAAPQASPTPPPAEVTKAAEPEKPADIPAPEDVAAPSASSSKTASGLVTKILTKGTGKDHPQDNDQVKVHYTGWTKDGKMFDSSVQRGEPTSFGVTQVIPGWTEALKLMVTGEKRRLWIPANLAYGDVARQPGAPTGQLTFDVDLLDIIPGPKPPETPKDVAAPPKDAKKTPSGLAYKVLKAGQGKTHPTATSRVTVHYSGWTKDGKMFDSSVVRNSPSSFPLNGVIPGWTEGVQLMVEGEKTRFWIPGKIAYGDTPKRPGAPAGQLTFEIELISIH